MLIDWSKAFDYLTHQILAAKMETYGFNLNNIELFSTLLKTKI